MKKFHLSLFQKIFLITFIGLFVVQTTNVYLDYRKLCNETANRYSDEATKDKLESLEHYYFDNASSLTKEDMIQKINETFKDTESYVAIVENQDILLENVSSLYFSEYPHMFIVDEEALHDYAGQQLSLENLPEETVAKLEDYIENHKNKEYFTIQYVGEECNVDQELEQQGIYHWPKYNPTFLQIDDQVIVGTNDEQSRNYKMNMYLGKQLYYIDEDKGQDIEAHIITKDELHTLYKESVLKSIKDKDLVQGYVDYDYEKLGDHLIFKHIIHFNSNGKFDDLSVVVADYYESVFDDVFENAIEKNKKTYILSLMISFLTSLLISYMITKRIKRISSAAHLISRNRFDMELNENPKDELGNLSADINRMSRNLKSTIDKLNQEIEHVRELESLRKDFVNQFTHEMKTPLGIINGYSELLDETEDCGEKEKYLDIINRETGRINELIQSMLSLSRLEAGKVELNKEDIDLEDLVTDIIEDYEVLLMKKNIHIEVKTIQSQIYADHKYIQTVVRNFLSNAIKHTYENGKIVVMIDHGISVFNEGDTIEQERLESIWYTFVTHDKEGSGLGLAICRSILELHGMKYGVVNKDNGVEFYFQ